MMLTVLLIAMIALFITGYRQLTLLYWYWWLPSPTRELRAHCSEVFVPWLSVSRGPRRHPDNEQRMPIKQLVPVCAHCPCPMLSWHVIMTPSECSHSDADLAPGHTGSGPPSHSPGLASGCKFKQIPVENVYAETRALTSSPLQSTKRSEMQSFLPKTPDWLVVNSLPRQPGSAGQVWGWLWLAGAVPDQECANYLSWPDQRPEPAKTKLSTVTNSSI